MRLWQVCVCVLRPLTPHTAHDCSWQQQQQQQRVMSCSHAYFLPDMGSPSTAMAYTLRMHCLMLYKTLHTQHSQQTDQLSYLAFPWQLYW